MGISVAGALHYWCATRLNRLGHMFYMANDVCWWNQSPLDPRENLL